MLWKKRGSVLTAALNQNVLIVAVVIIVAVANN